MIKSIIQRALVLSAMALAASAHAVVEPGHWQLTSASFPGSNFAVNVDQDTNGDYTGVFMNYAGGQLQGITYNVDQGADIFVVKAGDVFSNASIASQASPFIHGVSVEGGLPTSIVNVGQEFYLGARTRQTYVSGYFDTFGWGHFKVDASGVPQLLGSAMAFKESGIVVGTTQAIPEPSTLALMGIGLAGLAWRSKSGAKNRV